jgi:hypothetical protein
MSLRGSKGPLTKFLGEFAFQGQCRVRANVLEGNLACVRGS